jgi:dihydroorotase
MKPIKRKGEPLPKPKTITASISNGLIRNRWRVARSRRAKNHVHVYPLKDLREHQLEPECWCKPVAKREGSGLVITHSSMDGRELIEVHGIQ